MKGVMYKWIEKDMGELNRALVHLSLPQSFSLDGTDGDEAGHFVIIVLYCLPV